MIYLFRNLRLSLYHPVPNIRTVKGVFETFKYELKEAVCTVIRKQRIAPAFAVGIRFICVMLEFNLLNCLLRVWAGQIEILL